VKDGVPGYAYNFLGLEQTSIVADKPLAPGKATVKFDFAYDGGGPARAEWARSTSTVRRSPRAGSSTPSRASSARMRRRRRHRPRTPVVEAIGAEHASKFSGHIPKVTVEVRK